MCCASFRMGNTSGGHVSPFLQGMTADCPCVMKLSDKLLSCDWSIFVLHRWRSIWTWMRSRMPARGTWTARRARPNRPRRWMPTRERLLKLTRRSRSNSARWAGHLTNQILPWCHSRLHTTIMWDSLMSSSMACPSLMHYNCIHVGPSCSREIGENVLWPCRHMVTFQLKCIIFGPYMGSKVHGQQIGAESAVWPRPHAVNRVVDAQHGACMRRSRQWRRCSSCGSRHGLKNSIGSWPVRTTWWWAAATRSRSSCWSSAICARMTCTCMRSFTELPPPSFATTTPAAQAWPCHHINFCCNPYSSCAQHADRNFRFPQTTVALRALLVQISSGYSSILWDLLLLFISLHAKLCASREFIGLNWVCLHWSSVHLTLLAADAFLAAEDSNQGRKHQSWKM